MLFGWDSWIELLIGLGVAIAGGMINGIAGGGTVLVFPVLVWLGLGAVEANITNAFSLWTSSLGGALGFRRNIAEAERRWLWLAIPSLVGGILGAVLLVHLPPDVFESAAPFLVLGGSLVMLLQRPVTWLLYERHEGKQAGTHPAIAVVVLLVISIYGGYFGAGLGIFLIATLGLLGLTDLFQANGLKNLFSFLIKGVAVLYFVITGEVVWHLAIVMTVGAILGGYIAARAGTRVSQETMRAVIIAIGVLMAIAMFAGVAG